MKPTWLILLAGCATVGSVSSRPPDEGAGRIYAATLPAVRSAAQSAFLATKMQTKKTELLNDSTAIMIGTQPTGAWTYGEVVRVLMVGHADSTEVRIISAKRMDTNVFAEGNWGKILFEHMAVTLADTGRRLPNVASPREVPANPAPYGGP